MNRHYENADSGRVDGELLSEVGIVCEAILSLAYEQRTANLIAALSMGPIALTEGSIGVVDDRLIAIQREVLERLDAH